MRPGRLVVVRMRVTAGQIVVNANAGRNLHIEVIRVGRECRRIHIAAGWRVRDRNIGRKQSACGDIRLGEMILPGNWSPMNSPGTFGFARAVSGWYIGRPPAKSAAALISRLPSG